MAILFGGFFWAGYNLANFTLLPAWMPDEQRPRAISGAGRFIAMLLFAWRAARPAVPRGKGLPTHKPSTT